MATNKVVTVTVPSSVSNDTLASYNIYSDQDGLLDNCTPAEATAGHTVSLSDGVVHSVTVKPVGTSNGEFSAVVSNAISVDLTAGTIIVDSDDFTGTTINVTRWTTTENFPADGTITQNGTLNFNKVSNTSITNRTDWQIITDTGRTPTGSNTFCWQVDMADSNTIALTGWFGIQDNTTPNDDRVLINQKTDGDTRIIITENSVALLDVTSTLTQATQWKIELVGTTVKVYYWNGSWTQAGTTQSPTTWSAGHSFDCIMQASGGASQNGKVLTFDNFYVTDSTYTTQTPS